MQKRVLLLVVCLIGFNVYCQDFEVFDNFTDGSKSYVLKLKNNETEKNFNLQICCSATDCSEESISLIYDYNEEIFMNIMITMMKSENLNGDGYVENEVSRAKWRVIYDKLMKQLNKKEVLTELYDNQKVEYSGKLYLNETVTLHLDKDAENKNNYQKIKAEDKSNFKQKKNERKRNKKEIRRALRLQTDSENADKENPVAKIKNPGQAVTQGENTEIKPPLHIDKKPDSLTFFIEGASIRFFNNRINTISVDGHVGIVKKTITFENKNNSIPFRSLNSDKDKRFYNLKTNVNGVNYTLDCDEVLDYRHVDTEYNFTVKNKNYELKPNQEVKIESRNLFDYFTAIVFSDFLGINDTGNNSLLMAEGRAVIPLEVINRGNINGPHYFEGYLNTSLYNGQEEGKNFVEWKSKDANGGAYDKIEMFEFFKKKNVEAGLNFGIFALEWKGISTYVVLDYGVQFYRTRVRYFKDDANNYDDYQVYSIGHGPKIKFEIRPQVNFGADLNIGFMGYNYNGINSKSNLNDELRNHVIDDKHVFLNNFYILSNFYTKLNDKEKNNGLYFRLGGFYDFETSDISPQLMVGYATNLTSFINKFKKKDETPPAANSTTSK